MRSVRLLLVTVLVSTLVSLPLNAEEMPLTDNTLSDGTTFAEQLQSPAAGQVILLNTFLVPEGQEEAFRQGWTRAAEILRRQPGLVSTTLHRPVGNSRLWVNHAVWETPQALAAALASPDFKTVAAAMRQTGFRRLYQADTSLGPAH